MRTYLDYGDFLRDDMGRDIPRDKANRDYRRFLSEMDAGTAQLKPRPAPDPVAKWIADIANSDRIMSRHVEDIIDKIGTAGLPASTVAAHAAKKALRAAKPGG